MAPAVFMHVHYDAKLILLSVAIAILSAYAALDLAARVTSSRSAAARLGWIGGGAVAMGIGIWSMHYIGMLACQMPMAVLYDWPTVLLSMVAAVLASGIALFIASRKTLGWTATLLGSLSMGGGIAAMHYIGMAAMRMHATPVYSRPLVLLSVGLAVAIAFVALRLTHAFRHIDKSWSWRKASSALLMGCAIPVMHYTGMAAARWIPETAAAPNLAHAVNISDLGTASIALVTVVMLCLVFLTTAIDRRFSSHAVELESNEQRYRRILAAAFDAFIGFTSEGTITEWNEQAEKTFGWSAEEATGRSVNEMLQFETVEEGESRYRNLLEAEAAGLLESRTEVLARHKTGQRFAAEMAISAISTGGQKLFAAFVHDVTKRKLVESEMLEARAGAESANKAKSEFLANMSHEIRTPLNGVIGMTDLALETELTPEQRDYIETVKLSADSLLSVINDILDFSKIEAGKIDLEEIQFDLPECVETTLKTLALRADEKGLELLCEISPQVPGAVFGDEGRLRQIMTNLVGNAIKFTEVGEVSVNVEVEQNGGEDRWLHFTVSDTGIGIAAEKVDTIFESFRQADTSTTRHYGGTGLGLTISKRLIEIMGGRIWIESELGRGSRFHFVAPLKVAEYVEETFAPAATQERLVGVKVLIIDDNKTNRRILEGLLARWGMRATSAADGATALRKLADALMMDEPYRLVLTDMHMPQMDGFMVVQELQKNPAFSAATVMMLSSGGHRGDAGRCQELGIAAYLLKPVRQAELQEAIARALGARSTKKESPMITQKLLQAERPANQFLKVLLAEDNEVNQKLAVRLLEKRGHTVTVAGNGRQAVEALAAGAFDLVLMDVQMPEMDGIEATLEIRAAEKLTGRHQPIVAMTALVMKGDRERCLEAGMDGYLSKPIRPQELDEILDSYIARCNPITRSVVPGTQPLALIAEAAIDSADLMARVDGDVGFIAELTEILREDCSKKMVAMQCCVEAGDAPGVKRLAHGLKGALANLSARRAASLAGKIEALGTAGDLSGTAALISDLGAELARVLDHLQALCGERVL
jgi:two-component system sensor histidine kinase/response regulator